MTLFDKMIFARLLIIDNALADLVDGYQLQYCLTLKIVVGRSRELYQVRSPILLTGS